MNKILKWTSVLGLALSMALLTACGNNAESDGKTIKIGATARTVLRYGQKAIQPELEKKATKLKWSNSPTMYSRTRR